MIIDINISSDPYEICTLSQAAIDLGLTHSTYVYQLIRTRNPDGTIGKLDICYPYKNGQEKGPKFIVKNEKYFAMKNRHNPDL